MQLPRSQGSQISFSGYFFDQNQQIESLLASVSTAFSRRIYIADERPVAETRAHFSALSVLSFSSSAEYYLRESVVRAKPVCDAILRTFHQENSPLLLFIEMTWAVRTPSGDIYLRELQEAFQSLLAQNPDLSIICLYNESILLEEQLWLSLFAHPTILNESGEVLTNPHYLPPELRRKNQLKPRFSYWLQQLDPYRMPTAPSSSGNASIVLQDAYPLEKPFQTRVAQGNEGRWKIRCFGELRIHRENGELIEWNTKAGATKKIKTLFAFLLSRGDRGATAEELADLLWPDADDSEQALNRLYHVVRYLRLVLGGQQETKNASFVVHQGATYYLRLPFDSWIDLPMFQELCFKGNQFLKEGLLEQVRICYESAERLYSGDLFQDIPAKYIDSQENDWLWSRRYWYKEMYHKLLYSLASIYRQMGDLSLSLKYCDKALSEDPSLEAAHKEKMLSLAASQRFDALHRQYRIYVETCKKFNSGQPSEEIRQIYLNLSKKN